MFVDEQLGRGGHGGGGHGGGGHGGGGAHHHGGGGGGHPRPHPGPGFRRGRGFGPGGWWGPWYPWDTYVDTVTQTCTTWGAPAPMTPDLDMVGKRLLSASGSTQSASAYVGDVLYLFSYDNGTIRAQPCIAMATGVTGLSGADCGCKRIIDLAPAHGSVADAPANLPIYFLYFMLPGMGMWSSPTGEWMSTDALRDTMQKLLASDPTAHFGAYAWDGQAMTWQTLSTYGGYV